MVTVSTGGHVSFISSFFYLVFFCHQHKKYNYNLHVSHNHQKQLKNTKKLMAGPPETDIYTVHVLVVHNVYNNSIKYNNNHNNKINNKRRLITIYRANNGRLHIHV